MSKKKDAAEPVAPPNLDAAETAGRVAKAAPAKVEAPSADDKAETDAAVVVAEPADEKPHARTHKR